MKAVQISRIGGPEVLETVELPEPAPGPGFVRVANRAIGVNFHDINVRRGDEPNTVLPMVPGADFAGLVDAIGEGVEGIHLGDPVVCIHMHGGYAEKSLAMAPLAVLIPEALSFEQAAACPVAGLTAYFLVHQVVPIHRGTRVVVHAAAGSVGCFMGGLLRAVGAVGIGLVSSEAARSAGYVHVVNYRAVDPVTAVRELTGGDGADVVFDSVAGPAFGRSIEMVATGGTVVLFGRAAGDPPLGALDQWLRSRRNISILTYFLGTTLQTHLDAVPGAFQALFDGLLSGSIWLPLEIVPLAAAARAHARIEAQQTVRKVILKP